MKEWLKEAYCIPPEQIKGLHLRYKLEDYTGVTLNILHTDTYTSINEMISVIMYNLMEMDIHVRAHPLRHLLHKIDLFKWKWAYYFALWNECSGIPSLQFHVPATIKYRRYI